jgi:integrating conjugative element protein (TIGR03749 family)
MKPSLALLLLLGLGVAAEAQAVEILHWDRLPLSVQLIVGDERVVIVGSPVRVGLADSLDGRLRVQSADGAVYLLGTAPIESTQLEVQDLRTGELILLDVTARRPTRDQAPLEPIRIVDDVAGNSNEAAPGGSETRRASESTDQMTPPTPLAVALTRYAAQSLYAPLRTVEPVPGISEEPVASDLPLDTLLPTLPVRATVLAAWRLSGECVTAVKLTNSSARWISLDPRLLQGDFVAATFQHPDLGPAGRSTDTTVVYLVTRGGGLAGSLLPHASRFDAMRDFEKRAGSSSALGGDRTP